MLYKFGSNLGFKTIGSSVISVNSARGRHLIAGVLRSASRRNCGRPRRRAGAEKTPTWFPLASWPSYIACAVAVLLRFASSAFLAAMAAIAEPPSPLSFFHLRAFSNPTECTTTFAVICRPSCAPFSVATTTVVPLPPEQSPASRLLAWPAGHRPPLAMLRTPSGSPRHPVARPPLQLPLTSLRRPEIKLLRRPLFSIRDQGLRLQIREL